MNGSNPPSIALVRVNDRLPAGFERLCQEAHDEGFAHVDRLADDWASGALRFAGPGEMLLAAELGGELVGIGGATREPALTQTLRLRRFYVRPAFRKAKVGQALALELIRHAQDLGQNLSLNALTPEACAFWERLGFAPDERGLGFTHWMGCERSASSNLVLGGG